MISALKERLAKSFSHFLYFYGYLGYRVVVSLVLTVCVGFLDGLGLTMFFPMLQMVSGNTQPPSADGMGGMDFVLRGFDVLGIQMTLKSVLVVIIVFFSLKGIAFFMRQYYNVVVRMYFIKTLRFTNIDGLANFRYKSFVLADSGRIHNTLSGEVSRVSQAYVSYFSMLQSVMLMWVYVILALFTNLQFALLVIFGGFISNLLYQQIYKRTKILSARITKGGHRFQRQLIQFVGHFKYLKATAKLGIYKEKLKDSVVYIEETNKRIGFYNSLLSATKEPLNIAVVAFVIFLQIYFFQAALTGIILALMFFYRALTYIMNFQTHWNSFLNVSGSLENMTAFVRELKANAEVYGLENKEDFRGELELRDISFNYGEKTILKNITLHIPANKTIALVGSSGSGKTTLVNIIAGTMSPDSGAIYIDGIDYTRLDIRCLQKYIGYISQDPVVFSETIYNNVSLWTPGKTENIARFWQACEKACIAEYIRSLPKGMDTKLGNNGIELSGGQKQRLSIARELFKHTSILIMDEATSALDGTIEGEIKQNIDVLNGDCTMIIIAHRLSTIQNADCIYLMTNDGQIESSGNFAELQKKSARFKQMVDIQEF